MKAHVRLLAAILGLSVMVVADAVERAPLPTPQSGKPAQPVRIIAPHNLATVLGAAKIVLEVNPPAGQRVEKVEIRIDGAVVATLTAPPWSAEWNAGENGGNHLIEARAVFADGSVARDAVQSSALRIDQVEEVALVNVYAIAKDGGGAYVTDLKATEFTLAENGKPQQISQFSSERKPLRIALVLDTSLSMKGEKMKAAQEAALEFLKALGPGDEGVVISFSDRVNVLHKLTADGQALAAAVRSTEAIGGTALYDAVWEASNLLTEFDGRRVLVLLSDGRDEAASGLEPGSLHTAEESIERALRNEVIVFAIGLGDGIARDAKHLESDPQARVEELDFFGRRPLVSILRQMTDTTGGRAIFTSGPSKLRRAFEEVAADLRHQYALAYAPLDRKHDGTWREIRLLTTRQGVKVTNRKGYFAPRDAATR